MLRTKRVKRTADQIYNLLMTDRKKMCVVVCVLLSKTNGNGYFSIKKRTVFNQFLFGTASEKETRVRAVADTETHV